MADPSLPRQSDRDLVDSILGGSVEAWHDFVQTYSGLVLSVVRRYLRLGGEDERRSMFVEILRDLYDDRLRAYDDAFALSTWVAVVSRSRCLDHLRTTRGRRRLPKGVLMLSSFDQEVYRLFYLEGLGYDAICERLSTQGDRVAVECVVEAMARIDARVGKAMRDRLAYDLQARSVGVASGRLLQYLDELRAQNDVREGSENPEFDVLQRETRAMIARVESCIQRLSTEDRRALYLRFYDEDSADVIAAKLNLGRRRRAYTVVDRALTRLRRLLEVGEVP